MKEAIESFHIGDGEGGETFVRGGTVLPDSHPFVLHAPLQFKTINEHMDAEAPKRRPTKVA